MSLAKILDNRTYTVCGTPEYMAPEMLSNAGYKSSVDFWAFGILIYEMNCGIFINLKALLHFIMKTQ